MRDAVSSIDTTGLDDAGIFRKVISQIKLNKHDSDIAAARDRIRSHTMSLSLMLSNLPTGVIYVERVKASAGLELSMEERARYMNKYQEFCVQQTVQSREN